MGFEFIKKLPTPDEIRNQYPIDAKIKALKEKRDQEIRDVFTGKSDKFLAIIGPCSADNEDAVCDYLLRLRKVQDKIADKVLIIPRVYTNKPRTTGEGYKGMVHQPDPEKKPNMLAGLVAIRKMHIRAIEESEFTCADEMLYPENWRYLSDLLSYVAVGARSVEDRAAPSDCQRYGRSGRNEEPYQWRLQRYAELCCGSSGKPYFHLQRMGS